MAIFNKVINNNKSINHKYTASLIVNGTEHLKYK